MPAGGDDECTEIARWLYTGTDDRSLTDLISNSSDAFRWVFALGCWLLADLRALQKSTTITIERDRLKKIVSSAKELLKASAPYTGQSGHLAHVAIDSNFAEMKLNNGNVTFDRINDEKILTRPLKLLIARAQDAQLELDKVAKMGRDRDPIFTRVYGDPRKTLAVRCATLLLEARGPDAAPIKEGGPVSDMTSRVWRFATGIAPGDDIDRIAKEGAKIARHQVEGKRKARLRMDGMTAKKLSMLP